MAIERFAKAEFEEALPSDKKGNPLWTCLGLMDGEYVYEIEVKGTNKRIMVRSSIGSDGIAADTGSDSIRHWVEYWYKDEWYALGKHDTRWTARTKNWRSNLVEKLRELYQFALEDDAFRAKAEHDRQEESSDVPNCPKCAEPMVQRHRRSDNQPFWGCSQFPDCRGTRPFSVVTTNGPVKKAAKFEPTPEQKAIFEYIRDPDGTDAVVEALAGTGKTTTIVEALKYTRGKVLFCAFNKRIADELRQRAPSHVTCATIHSAGFRSLNNAFPHKPIVDDGKKYSLAKELLPDNDADSRYTRSILCKVASLVQATLTDPTNTEAVQALIEHYSVETNGFENAVLQLLPQLINLSLNRTTVVDFDDMIYMPIMLNLSLEKYDWVFVDEAQDLNKSQLALVLRLVSDRGRVICVGDRHQSIYGFRGADVEAIPRLIRELNEVEVLPLTVSWRCPQKVVQAAQQLVPQFQAAPSADVGEVVEDFSEWQLHRVVQDGDMILCRVNAPLVRVCYMLIKHGKKATIVGRDIGKGLISLIDRLGPQNVTDLLYKVREYKYQELAKLEAAGKTNQAQALEDKCDTLIALSEGVGDLTMLRARIESIFTDRITGVSLSSVHRAKGLEADTVYILHPELMPFPKASKPWEIVQEKNVLYVALTRAKKKLVIINGSVPAWHEPVEVCEETVE